jgi:hypothetical protein
MQPALKFIALVIFMMPLFASAQSGKGFDYAAHRKMNKKAAKWGKSRIKASDGDYTNMQCSVRKTRRHAKKANE